MRRARVIVAVATAVAVLVIGGGAPTGAVDFLFPGTPEPPPPAGPTPEVVSAQRWVRAVVLDLLGRSATEEEVAAISGRLAAGTSRGTIARELARSDEWIGAVVTDLYRHVLGRDPEPDGLAYWVDRLRTGDRVASVAVSIYAADEYDEEAGGTPGGYVDALYESILGRAPDADGRAYWVTRLESGVNRWRVARELFLAREARARRVDALYETLLDRPASAGDRTYWADRLATEDDIVLAAHLVASAEHHARAQTRPETVGPTAPPAAEGGWVGVSGDGATVIQVRGGFFSAALEAVDSTSGVVDPLHDVAVAGNLFPVVHLSRPSVSDDGRYVAVSDSVFQLFGGHPGGGMLIDRLEGTTTDLDGPSAKAYEPTIAPDGSAVAYRQRGGATDDIVVRDVTGGTTTVVAAGNGHSAAPRLSGDGRFVVFTSGATDLVAGDDNGQPDVFLHDRTDGTTTRLTDGDGPSGAPWISADGSTVAFASTATDLVDGDSADDGAARDLYVWDRATGEVDRVSDGTADASRPSVSGDGRHVAFLQGAPIQAKVWDRTTGEVTVLGGGVADLQVTTDGAEVVGDGAGASGDTFTRWPLGDADRLTLVTEPLPAVDWGEPYTAELEVTGGPGARVVDARLPAGLALVGQSITGTVTGRPAPTALTLVLADDTGRRTVRRLTVEVQGEGTLAHVPIEGATTLTPSITPDGATIAYTRDLGGFETEVRIRTGDGTDTAVAEGLLPSLADDGETVALLSRTALLPADTDVTYDAYLVGPGGTVPLAHGTPGTGAASAVALSGDGTTAVVATDAEGVVGAEAGPGTYVVDVATGAATRLTADAGGPVAISADGSVVVVTEPNPIQPGQRSIVRIEGGTRTVVGEVDGVPTLDLSADGDTVVFGATSPSTPEAALRLWSAGTGTSVVVDAGPVRQAVLSDDGSVVMFAGGAGPGGAGRTGDLHRWERATGEVSWAVTRRSLDEPTGSGVASFDVSADGTGTVLLSDEVHLPEAAATPGVKVYRWTAPA